MPPKLGATKSFGGSFFGGFDDADDDEGANDDGATNAFTFSLLGQLKDSLVTYDNSLKGFLDIGKAASVAAGITTAEGEDGEATDEKDYNASEDRTTTPRPRDKSVDKTRDKTPVTARTPARDKSASREADKALEEQRLKNAKDLEEARALADSKLKKTLEEEEKKRVEKIAEIEERKKKLAAERADNDGALLELDNVKNAKLKDEQKIEQLTKGWRMEREQGELVKMAMDHQHKIEIEAVKASGREKMAAMQNELVQTMAMLEKMYSGWQASLEDALTEMRISSEEERRKAVAAAREEGIDKQLALEKANAHLQEQYQVEYARRKISHNKLIEMMGNIRVICRVRPINKTEINSGKGQDCTAYPFEGADENIIIKTPTSDNTVDPDDPGNKYEFDTVFGPQSTQVQVFNELKPLVTSCMDGFSVTIFAYGQTGSGKTYTMEGGSGPDGLCYRAFEELFNIRDSRCESGRMSYSIKVSMLEIYNEQVRDLLTPRLDSAPKSLDIRVTQTGSEVVGLTQFEVHTPTEVQDLMLRGNSSRAVGGHSMNERSSRSHSCIRITITGENLDKGTMINSKLYLIDLAGSERIAKTDATGTRLKEAQNINKSLSALGNVMQALGKASKGADRHVPFRDSKLTYLLQDSLSGGSKVLMFVNVSPAAYNHSETVSSLNFAARCRAIELGKAVKQEESGEGVQLRRDVASLKKELEKAKAHGEAKEAALREAEKREMTLSAKMSEALDSTSAKTAASEAMAQQHKARLDALMDERAAREQECAELKELLAAANASTEHKEEELTRVTQEISQLHEDLSAAKEAKVAAEGSAMGIAIELKNAQRELESEREKSAKSETSVVANLKQKLHTMELKEKELTSTVAKLTKEAEAAASVLESKEKTIASMEEDLTRGRADYSALLTKMTMQRYESGGGGGGGGGSVDGVDLTAAPMVNRPLVTEILLRKAHGAAKASRLPTAHKASALPSPAASQAVKLYVPSGFVPLKSPSGDASSSSLGPQSPGIGRGSSLSERPGGSKGGGPLKGGSGPSSLPSPGRNAVSMETAKSLEERRLNLAKLSAMADEGQPRSSPLPRDSEDDDDNDRALRQSLASSEFNSVNSERDEASAEGGARLKDRLASVAGKNNASSGRRKSASGKTSSSVAKSTTTYDLTLSGDADATDAEFAVFQAQFVSGLSLTTVTLGASSGKPKRRQRTFTIRFLAKRGLTLVWSKRESLVLAHVTEVFVGGPGADRSSGDQSPAIEPGKLKSRPSWSLSSSSNSGSAASSSGLAVDSEKTFCLKYLGSATSSTPTSATSSRAAGAKATTSSEASLLVLEVSEPSQRNHLARCFRRLAHQERERSTFLLDS